MMKFLRKNTQTILLITVIGFVAGIFIGFGSYFFGSERGNTIAEVNGIKIPIRKYTLLFNRVMDRYRENNTEINDQLIEKTKQEVIQDLIQEEVFSQEAKKYTIIVSDKEVAYDIHNWPAFQKDGRFDQRTYFQVLAWRLRMTPEEFEESRRRQIAIAKLREYVASGVKITEKEFVFEYARRNSGDMKKFEKEKQSFYNTFLREKINDVFNEWYKLLGASIKVKVNTDLIK